MIFYYSLTATPAHTFGYVKCTPDVDFTASFLDIVLGQYFRQGIKKNATKNAELVHRRHFLLVNISHGVM